jgi:hypothetical protein
MRRTTPGMACEQVVEEVGRAGWMDELTLGQPTVTTSGPDFAVVRFELPSHDVYWFRAVRGDHGWLLQRGPWDDAQSA